jgi:hypothetical protein
MQKAEWEEINKRLIKNEDLFAIAHNYLIYNGFEETVRALESEASFDKIHKQ